MNQFQIKMLDEGSCEVCRVETDTRIVTDLPKEYGGRGRSFSATDLVAAGLGACMATTLRAVAKREGIEAGELTVTVTKTLSEKPKKIQELAVTVEVPAELTSVTEKKLRRAASLCPVHRSLHPEVGVTLNIVSRADHAR